MPMPSRATARALRRAVNACDYERTMAKLSLEVAKFRGPGNVSPRHLTHWLH